MSQSSQSSQRRKKGQPYDSTIKAMLKEDAAQIVPLLLPNALFVGVLDIEIIQSTLRVDRAYLVEFEGETHIVQLEFQAGADSTMVKRLLAYHTNLWYDHEYPVLSHVVYFFPCTVPQSPFRERNKLGREFLTFHFEVTCMWKWDARLYLQQRKVYMYPLLPTMGHANAFVLLQAIDELLQFHRQAHETPLLGLRLLWFGVFLRRSKTVSKQDKKRVRLRLDAFDYLLEHDPYLKMRDQQNFARGKDEGKVEGISVTLLGILKIRFPSLYMIVETRIQKIKDTKILEDIIKCAVSTSDEATVRAFIETRLPA